MCDGTIGKWKWSLAYHMHESELMFHNNGLLHHVTIAVGCRPTVLSAMLANNFSTSMCFAISHLIVSCVL